MTITVARPMAIELETDVDLRRLLYTLAQHKAGALRLEARYVRDIHLAVERYLYSCPACGRRHAGKRCR